MNTRTKMYHFLAVHEGELTVQSKPLATRFVTEYGPRKIVRTIDELAAIVSEQDLVMCSSSLDFPEENTTEQRVIDLCNQIRGN